MRFFTVLLPFALVAPAFALPQAANKRDISALEDVILFDAPAFQHPGDPSVTVVSQQALVYIRQIDLSPITKVLSIFLAPLGLGDKIETAVNRLRLFSAVGLAGKELKLTVEGCNQPLKLGASSGLPDLGLLANNVSAGQCTGADQYTAVLDASYEDSSFTSKIYPSGPGGFGIISDIDDTVKVSNVLDTFQVLKSTLFEEPKAVNGMPDLYASLALSLNSPQFVYVTGSPMQLYPFLRDFIDTQFSASAGPIVTKNLTLIDISGLLSMLFDENDTLDYKVDAVDRIHGMYPGKKFLTVGDSTQADPEVYATSYKKYGDWIACIWIRKVDGADNSDERFASAFEGVPASKYRVYTDSEIAGLADIDVAGGKC